MSSKVYIPSLRERWRKALRDWRWWAMVALIGIYTVSGTGCDFEFGYCRTIRVMEQCLAEPNCRTDAEQLNYYRLVKSKRPACKAVLATGPGDLNEP